MDDTSANVHEYRSYWLSMPVKKTLRDIMVLVISVSGRSKQRKKFALKVVDVSILS